MTSIYEYYQVTPEEVDFCTRIEQNGKVHYRVASRTTIGTDYKVEYNTTHRVLQCNCPAGSQGNGCWQPRRSTRPKGQ